MDLDLRYGLCGCSRSPLPCVHYRSPVRPRARLSRFQGSPDVSTWQTRADSASASARSVWQGAGDLAGRADVLLWLRRLFVAHADQLKAQTFGLTGKTCCWFGGAFPDGRSGAGRGPHFYQTRRQGRMRPCRASFRQPSRCRGADGWRERRSSETRPSGATAKPGLSGGGNRTASDPDFFSLGHENSCGRDFTEQDTRPRHV